MQQRSIAESYYNYGIKVDPSSECYDIGYKDVTFQTQETVCLENNIDITNTSTWTPAREICFDSFGAPIVDGSPGMAIYLQDPEGSTLNVNIEPITGRIILQ